MKNPNLEITDVSLLISEYPSHLDRLIREKFNDSLRYLFTQLHDQIPFKEKQLDLMSEHILSHKITPRAFAQFYDLVLNINQTGKDETNEILENIISLTQSEPSFQILPYLESSLGDEYLLFPKLIFSGFAEGNPMAPPKDEVIDQYAADIRRALELIQLVDIKVYDEIQALITMIVFCDKNPDDRVRPFGGASSLMTWGGLLLNTQTYSRTEDIISGLVHEVTHTALFGINEQETLVLNPVDENFSSPLRDDNRPMDGIYHATIVSARVSLFFRKIQNNSIFDELDKERVDRIEKHSSTAFYAGLKTINDGALLSTSAKDLLERFTRLIDLTA